MNKKHIKQFDEQDCGPACISMILKSYGSKLSIETLRDMSGTTINGTTAWGIKKCFELLNFECSVIKSNQLPTDKKAYPLIAHVLIDNSILHYVVIHKYTENYLLISDPATTRIKKIGIVTFKNLWTGILLLPKPEINYTIIVENNRPLLSNLHLFSGQVKNILQVVIFSALLFTFGIAMSFYYQFIIDQIIPKKQINTLFVFSIGLFSILTFQLIVSHIRTKTLIKISLIINSKLIKSYISHVLLLPINFFNSRKNGDIVSRFLDASKIIEALSDLILIIFIDIFMLLGMSVLLLRQNTYLFWVAMLTIPVYGVIIYLFYKPLEEHQEKEMIDNSKLNSLIIESLQGIETIKVYNMEEIVANKIDKSIDNMMKTSLKVAKLNSAQQELKIFLDAVSTLVILWIGSIFVINNKLTIGQLMTFNSLLIYFTNPLKNIINIQMKMQTANIANTRLNDIMNLPVEKNKSNMNNTLNSIENIQLDLSFSNVSYAYNDSSISIHNINLQIPSKSKFALVGESGSGKSTIAKLIVKFFEPTEGKIVLGNSDLNILNTTYLRNLCTYVSQDTFFFSGSLKENLIFGSDYIPSIDKIIVQCKKADIYEFIDRLPNKFETIIDEGGTNLSNGQKQRLAIARSLIKNNKLIIFDEATSSLDTISEQKIIKNLLLEKERTLIFISHRLIVAEMCELIAVIDQGSVVEYGTHDTLLRNKKKYFELNQPTEK